MTGAIGFGVRRGAAALVALMMMASFGASWALDAQEVEPRTSGGDKDEKRAMRVRAFGLTDDGRLVRFRTNAPEKARTVGLIAGLSGSDTALIGIDFRVQDGKLYGVGNFGGVYTIDTMTAAATFVNALSVALSGASFGVDFNPAADRLRIISDTGQNLAHNVNAGGTTVMNSALTYTAPPAAPVVALGVVAAAYTNNDLSTATATTLFDIDTMLDQVAVQSPPGTGVLLATGKLGADVGANAGFDIYTWLEKGVASGNYGFATLAVAGKYSLFSVNLLTGAATAIGPLADNVFDIAIRLN
jgi:hypothetical protein